MLKHPAGALMSSPRFYTATNRHQHLICKSVDSAFRRVLPHPSRHVQEHGPDYVEASFVFDQPMGDDERLPGPSRL